MYVNLNEIDPDKPLVRNLEEAETQVPVVSGTALIQDLRAYLRFRVDPLGFVVRVNAQAKASLDCIRCGGRLWHPVETSEWIALRQHHPRDAHVALAGAEMNVRFIDSLQFDAAAFVHEMIELELPSYPRHPEGDPVCAAPMEATCGETAGQVEPEEANSPFSVLSKYLDQPQ